MTSVKYPSRRNMLVGGAAVAAFSIVPASVLARSANKKGRKQTGVLPPSERLNLGFVGIGGRGLGNVDGCSAHNIHSLCDVDAVQGAESFEKYPKAKRFDDWRVMLEREAKNLDAVVVSTPDHNGVKTLP